MTSSPISTNRVKAFERSVFGPCTLRRTWGTRPEPTAFVWRSTVSFDFLLGKAQHAGQDVFFHGESVYSRQVFFGKIAKNVARRHFKKEITAQFSGNGGGIVPANTVSDVVREISRDELRGAHGSRVHVANVGQLWLSQA